MFKRLYLLGISLIIFSIPSVNARVTQLEITEIISIAGGKHFGDIGAYEKVSGIAYFEISPDHKRNKIITDIARARINADGNVEFNAKFEILRPVDPSKASGTLFVEAPSQGEKLSLGLLHDIDETIDLNFIDETTDLGNGFLFERGHTVACIAWQAQIEEIDHRLVVDFPITLENDQPVTGFILTEFNGKSFKDQNPYTLPLSGRDFVKSFPTISTDQETAKASLFVMESGSTDVSSSGVRKGEAIPADQWQFAHCPDGWPGESSSTFICVKNGFLKNRNYHLIYQAVDSPVMGLGLATTRDFISHLRHENKDSLGNQSPTSDVKHVICQGIGQGAEYLRDFLYQGFNVDLNNQKVCDGMNIHAAGVEKTYLNYRFSQPYRVSTQHS